MRRAQDFLKRSITLGKKKRIPKDKSPEAQTLLKVVSNYSGGIPPVSFVTMENTKCPHLLLPQSIYLRTTIYYSHLLLPSTIYSLLSPLAEMIIFCAFHAVPSQGDGRHQGALLFHLLWGAKTLQQGIYICLAGWALLLILMDLWCYHAIWTDFSMPIYVNMAEYLYVRIGFKMLIGWKMVWILLAWHHG